MNSKLAASLLCLVVISIAVFSATTIGVLRIDEAPTKTYSQHAMNDVDSGLWCVGDPVDGGHPNGNQPLNQTG